MTGIPPSAVAPKTPAQPAPPPAAVNSQDDIDAMLASLDEATTEAEVRPSRAEDVFELTDEMAVPDPATSFQKIEPEDLEFTEMAQAMEPPRRPAFEAESSSAGPAPAVQQILSHATVSAVETAFSSLANTVLSNNARTLEDLVREMLRPMLKSWLDDNLPGLVERIVKAVRARGGFTIVDLGMVRDVTDSSVAITPTYTGCPATLAIQAAVRVALDQAGFTDIAIRTVIDPPWTTDWITPEGHEKLRAYGIAPPTRAANATCPQCGSTHTEEVSRFGSTPCKALWRCLDCAEPFDRFKCH